MRLSIECVFLFVVLTAPTLLYADEQPAAAARAKAIAPYVDDHTVAIAHIDLSRVEIGPSAETLTRFLPEAKDEIARYQAEAAGRIKRFVQAGGKDVFLTVSLGGPGPIPRVLAILPLVATADEKEIRAALDLPTEAGQRVGGALVIRLVPTDNRPLEIRSSPRAELIAAFEAAGNGTVQAVLIPPAYTRRVIEELMPQLPSEIGGGPSSVLTRGISWAAIGIDLPPHLRMNLVVKSRDAEAAQVLRTRLAEVLRLVGQSNEVRTALPQFGKITAHIMPQIEDDRLVLNLDNKSAAIDQLCDVAQSAFRQARGAASRTQSMNNLRQLVLAMHMYNDSKKHFPAAASAGPDGKPLLSWRVSILPYMEQDPLFRQFHLNEPWDSPHNKTLIDKMPALFHPAGSKAEKGKTNYLVPVGNGAFYTSGRDEPKLEDVKDGPSQTIMMVEVDDEHAVTWTKPDDLFFDPKNPKNGIGSQSASGFAAAFCDGSVRLLSASIDPKTLSALFTRAGGEVIGKY